MTDAAEDRRDSLGADEARRVWPLRLIVGLVQGIVLWWLYRSIHVGLQHGIDGPQAVWPATEPTLFVPLLLVFCFVPVLVLGALGRMRPVTLALWAAGATAVLVLLGWHDAARQVFDAYSRAPWVTGPVMAFSAAALFIAHHLVLPADREGRLIADYPAYFDTAWKAGVQLVMSLAFTGVFWILLTLGAGLFDIIGLSFLSDLLREDWFSIPVTCFVFATAIHLTDVRDGLIRGVRTVALMLLSWLLPLMTLLAAGFLVALPFTGLAGLWETGSAAAMVLSAAALLIILINAAYQDGLPTNLPPAILRLSVRVAAVLLVPLTGIAAWALALRIGQYGLTPDRIIASACTVVGAVYALGYTFGATLGYHRLGRWMQPLERTNVWAGLIAVLLIVALFSPLLDPARLSVADQVARLERGAVTAERFDYRFLRYESGKAGAAALDRLAQSDDAAIAERARAARQSDNRYAMEDQTTPAVRPRFDLPEGAPALPDGFDAPVVPGDDLYGCVEPRACVARPVDLDGDGVLEVLVAQSYSMGLWVRDEDGTWRQAANYRSQACRRDRNDRRETLRQGLPVVASSRWPSLRFGEGQAIAPTLTEDCSRPRTTAP